MSSLRAMGLRYPADPMASQPPHSTPDVDDRIDLVGIGLWAFGLYQLSLGLFMVVAPGTFFEELGPFGARNDHYIRDDATFEIPLGVLFVVAALRPAWRVPALAFGTLHWALHSINHLLDIGDADPEWVGVFDFFALAAGTTLLAYLLWRAASPIRGTGSSGARRYSPP